MSYSADVLALSPLLYWRFGETSGTSAADSSGNGRNGTYIGSPTLGTAGLLWQDADKSCTFDGVNDRVEIADAAWMDVTTFSIVAMIKRTATSGSPQNVMIRVGSAGNFVFSFRLDSGKPTLFIFDLGVGSTYDSVQGPTALNLNEEYHVVCTFDDASNVAKMYVDGSLVATKTLSTTPASSANATINVGGNASGGDLFTGVLDEVSFHPTVFTAGQVTTLYQSALVATINSPLDLPLKFWFSPEYEATLVADGVQPTTITDLSGLNNHLTNATTGTDKIKVKHAGGPTGGAARFRFENGAYGSLPTDAMTGLTSAEMREYIKSDYLSSTAQGDDHFGSGSAQSNHYPFMTTCYDDWGRSSRTSYTPGPSINTWLRRRRWTGATDWGISLNGTPQVTASSVTVAWKSVCYIGNSNPVTALNTGTDTFEGDRGGIYAFTRKLSKPEDIAMSSWEATYPSGGLPFVNLTPADAAHGHTADASGLTQVHVLTPADAAHEHTSDGATVTETANLDTDDAAHEHATESPGVTQVHVLSPGDAFHGHVSSEPVVTMTVTLIPDATNHEHTTQSSGLTQVHALLPVNTDHSHTAESGALAQVHHLTPVDVLHQHTAESTVLGVVQHISPNDTLHTHTTESTRHVEHVVADSDRLVHIPGEDRRTVVPREHRIVAVPAA